MMSNPPVDRADVRSNCAMSSRSAVDPSCQRQSRDHRYTGRWCNERRSCDRRYGTLNAVPVNAGPVITGTLNAVPVNAGPVITGTLNAGPVNAGHVITGTLNDGQQGACSNALLSVLQFIRRRGKKSFTCE